MKLLSGQRDNTVRASGRLCVHRGATYAPRVPTPGAAVFRQAESIFRMTISEISRDIGVIARLQRVDKTTVTAFTIPTYERILP